MLHRSFPEADIDPLAQHFDVLDSGFADKALFRCRYANGRFRNNTFGEQATAVVSVVHKKTMAPLHDYKFVFSGRSVRKSWLSPLAPLMPPGHEMKHKPAADHANSRLL